MFQIRINFWCVCRDVKPLQYLGFAALLCLLYLFAQQSLRNDGKTCRLAVLLFFKHAPSCTIASALKWERCCCWGAVRQMFNRPDLCTRLFLAGVAG